MPTITEVLYSRLRQEPQRFSVPGSLPVLFFGDLLKADVATVGLNPSDREYVDGRGRQLDGNARRFETLQSLGTDHRSLLSDAQCAQAVERMRAYFEPGKPVYGWFRALNRVLSGCGVSYELGGAAHLDLVQEATNPTWSALLRQDPVGTNSLRIRDEAFLRWQLEAFPIRLVICTGRTVSDHMAQLLNVKPIERGTLARVHWQVGSATLGDRKIAMAGWNRPLARPTGLGAEGEQRLGQLLSDALRANHLME